MADKTPEQVAEERIEEARRTEAAKLNLRSLGLTLLPESIGQLGSLEELILHMNNLSSLPACVGQLSSLRRLYIGCNGLTSLPESIGRLAVLEKLFAFDNQLASLPESIGQLASLVRLHLRGNQLASLPDSIGRLPSLKTLELDNNQLTSLPESIGRLPSLKTLELDNNQLTSLPESLCRLRSLKALYLRANPALGIPPEVLGPRLHEPTKRRPARPADILDYYFRTRRGPTRALNEAKMVLIGDGEVGKTALVNLLVYKRRCTGRERKTQGIRIVPWQVPGRHKQNVRLNVWDFGGQEIMHATHQFFLTERTVYLVVVDARRGENESRLEYWLKLVQSLAKDSPVIVAANKIDEQRSGLDENTLREKYGRNVRDFAYTSCTKGTGAADLRRKIVQHVAGLEHVDAPVPVSYFAIKDEVAHVNRAWMPYADYQAICGNHGVSDRDSQDRLMRFLHDLGTMLSFPDLADTNVLAPEWVTKGVYGIVTSPRLAEQKGIFNRRDLTAMLPAKDYPRAQQQFIVDMMRKFELCYPVGGADTPAGGDDRWLVPGLLDANRPQEAAPTLGALRFQYKYRVLPASIIARFIVRTFENLHPAKLYWRNGIVLGIDGARATVVADMDTKTVDIAVAGEGAIARRNALAVVRAQFRSIHGSLASLEVEERVPLPDRPEVAVPYQWLLDQEKRGRQRAEWWGGQQNIEVDVGDLLNGVETKEQRAKVERFTRAERPVSEVFLSYAHKDGKWSNELRTVLAPALRGAKTLDLWYDGKIKPSQDWRREIEAAMRRARVGVLLVSKHFLASDFIANSELPFLIEAAEKADVKLTWVLISHALYDGQQFARLQALHDVGKPLAALRGNARDKVMKEIGQGILDLAR